MDLFFFFAESGNEMGSYREVGDGGRWPFVKGFHGEG